ncbi:MAG: polysaccharide export outer membrane protein [Crocinitomicaceae bacterium]|jgi:polysaccharide export outer membrane protein
MRLGLTILIGLFAVATMLGSCGVNSNLMFKQAKGDTLVRTDIPLRPLEEYRISTDDKIVFNLHTRDGARIIELMTGLSEDLRQGDDETEYTVRQTGDVKLPIVGLVQVSGLTISECEDTLADRYSGQYDSPFVQVRVTNQRVIVFPGNGSDAKVIPLLNSNTTLMEALAQAGGITDRGKANSVKLMRKQFGKRYVYQLDLSTLEGGLQYVDMIVQANDYIYIEPTPELSKEIAEDIVPIASLISSAFFIVSAINLLK